MKLFFANEIAEITFSKELNIKNILISYLQVRKSKLDLKKLKKEGINIMLDSGAYSFAVSNTPTRLNFDEFYEDYLEYIIKNQKYLFSYVELDIDVIVGVKKVSEWRKKMFDEGLNSIIVWHPIRGINNWENTVKKYDYVGFNTIKDIKNIKKMKAMVSLAKEYEKKVHGFGTTKQKVMATIPFYSVDSTSWKAGVRYGHIFFFEKGTIKSYEKKAFYKKFGRVFDFRGDKINRWNLLQWKKYATYLERL